MFKKQVPIFGGGRLAGLIVHDIKHNPGKCFI